MALLFLESEVIRFRAFSRYCSRGVELDTVKTGSCMSLQILNIILVTLILGVSVLKMDDVG